MTEISFSLIRACHGSVEKLEALQVIHLDHQGIAEIDNLEVFWDIRELYLSRNVIERIENIEFLDRLQHLDLSSNRITAEALQDAFDRFPRNLSTINLSGNPCANDEAVLEALSERYPELNIIIGLYAEGEEEDEADAVINRQLSHGVLLPTKDEDEEEEEDDDNEEEAEAEEDINVSPLNADEVLKSLVERKCRLQNVSTVIDVTDAVNELNAEYEQAIKDGADKLSKRWGDITNKSAVDVGERISTYQHRIQLMKDDRKENEQHSKQEIDDLTTRLKQTAKKAMLALDTDL